MTAKTPMFLSAIIGGEQDVIEMTPEEQEQVRQFILDENWTLLLWLGNIGHFVTNSLL